METTRSDIALIIHAHTLGPEEGYSHLTPLLLSETLSRQMLQFWQEWRIEIHRVFQCLPKFSRRQINNTDATAVSKYKYYAAGQQPDYLVVILTKYGL